MDNINSNTDEFSVDEGSFWHTNMDLYYGYQPGEVVEVEHEPNKYWLATIKYSYRQLLSLDWLGNYGNFWMDLSAINPSSLAVAILEGFYTPKRIFPLGYHLQSQLKSQFTLEKPTKVLDKPTLYNPQRDPYSNVETIDDLLALDIEDIQAKDAFRDQVEGAISEPASLVMAKCKTQIAFGQDDVDELEAALQNLTEIVSEEQPEAVSLTHQFTDIGKDDKVNPQVDDIKISQQESSKLIPLLIEQPEQDLDKNGVIDEATTNECNQAENDHWIQLCKSLQDSAINQGKYQGFGASGNKLFHIKPKQFYDIGGANHERLIVPGTLLEICHTEETHNGFILMHWFATVLKNVGGRLTLRWFLCDEPKFKQGRLELKSCRSQMIREEESSDESLDTKIDDNNSQDIESSKAKMIAKDLTFCMHICDPRIYSISYAKLNGRQYKMPKRMISFIGQNFEHDAQSIEKAQIEHIFDSRRMNLDKDRILIDHILSTIQKQRPTYLKITSLKHEESQSTRHDILISTPKTTRLFRGFVKREIEPGVYEIQSDPISDSGDVIRFIHPFDSSYSVLPINWSVNNEDCLSVACSRNQSPTIPNKTLDETDENEIHNAPVSGDIQIAKAEEEQLVITPELTLTQELAKNELQGESVISSDSGTHSSQESKQAQDESDINSTKFVCILDSEYAAYVESRFRVMDQLEVVHPSSDSTICTGRIRKVVYPLLWIQLSIDAYTLLPFNSTNIYPSGWGAANNQNIVSLLPSLKRPHQSSQPDKKKKKIKFCDNAVDNNDPKDQRAIYVKEKFDLGLINDKPLDIDYLLNDNVMFDRIYFNHKCFTGPSLSKGKICSLPQYVGPGPLRLVMEEVVTKVISVAYVPPRILNDLSSKTFEELLIARNLTNTIPIEFKAKYQKRTHREDIQVCLNPDDVALYCECICEHLKCCYNLFGPNLYDGDDCPGHCRALTKSNKFMKRATYYREKARLGEFTCDNNSSKKTSSNKTRPRYAGRGSSESTSSNSSRSENILSRASSANEDILLGASKENLATVEESEDNTLDKTKGDVVGSLDDNSTDNPNNRKEVVLATVTNDGADLDNNRILNLAETNKSQMLTSSISVSKPPVANGSNCSEFDSLVESSELHPQDWSIEEVAKFLERCRLERFRSIMMSEVSRWRHGRDTINQLVNCKSQAHTN